MKPTELTLKELGAVKEFALSKGIVNGEEFKTKYSFHSFEEMEEELADYLKGEYFGADEIMGFTEAINHIIKEQELPYYQISDEVWVKEKPNPTRWVVLHNTHGGILKEVIAYCNTKHDAEKWIEDMELEGIPDIENYEITAEGVI